ncbi:uncharacterized protein LOC111377900 [Olea europaea var. sylvestris]|uniref:uncharacterized protein LOC111377900 n=1 Tax=Olea europaea var. sylvestris TaxID=158386 RepID=UPI000C1D4634|nr:uncharacterized protein LOC111377900 [Olea europaea var. sylvestris]
MECRKFDITLVSANNLPNVRDFGRMKVYAEVSINGISKTAKKAEVDKKNECSPCWNCTIGYTIGERAVQQETGVEIAIKLFCKRTLGDRYIGEVKLPLKSLFENGPTAQNISYVVDGTASGTLVISYRFGEMIVVKKPSGWDTAIRIIMSLGVTLLIKGTIILITGGASDGGFDIPIFTDSCDIIDLVGDIAIEDIVVIE